MSFSIIQNTKINSQEFKFDNPKEVHYPVAPLVSAKLYTSENAQLTLKIRATLYINSAVTEAPTVEEPTEKGSTLTIKYDYNFSEEIPETCNVWYVEVDYTSDTVSHINKIESFLANLDPETSRATNTEIP